MPTTKARKEGGLEYRFVAEQLPLVGKMGLLTKADSRYHVTTLFPLFDAIEDSTDSLLRLARSGKMRDSYVISRVIYETTLNVCFILAGGKERAERAWRHAHQKTYRDLDRVIEIAGEQIRIRRADSDEVMKRPEVQKLISEFSSKKGREITSWTPENTQQRLETVLLNFGRARATGLLWGFLLYRHASDIAHGTLFGGLFAYGATQGRPKSVSDLVNFRADNIAMVLQLIGLSLNSLINIVGSETAGAALITESDKSLAEFSKARSAIDGA